MQVKIDINSFNGHAELSGVELDNLTKILVKFFGTDTRYLDGRYVQVRTDQKLAAKLEISTDIEFMNDSNYQIEKAAVEARENAKVEEQRLARAGMAATIIGQLQRDETIDVEALSTLLSDEQSLLYWNERHEQNAFGAFYLSDEGFYFYAGKPGAQKQLRITADGNFSRREI